MLLVVAVANFTGACGQILPVIWNACCLSSTFTLYLDSSRHTVDDWCSSCCCRVADVYASARCNVKQVAGICISELCCWLYSNVCFLSTAGMTLRITVLLAVAWFDKGTKYSQDVQLCCSFAYRVNITETCTQDMIKEVCVYDFSFSFILW